MSQNHTWPTEVVVRELQSLISYFQAGCPLDPEPEPFDSGKHQARVESLFANAPNPNPNVHQLYRLKFETNERMKACLPWRIYELMCSLSVPGDGRIFTNIEIGARLGVHKHRIDVAMSGVISQGVVERVRKAHFRLA